MGARGGMVAPDEVTLNISRGVKVLRKGRRGTKSFGILEDVEER